MMQKKFHVKVIIGSKVVRNEQINENLVLDYISSLKNFYNGVAKVEVC